MSNLTPRINDLESRDTQTDGKIAKNVIINGGFDFWQRGTSFVALASAEYFADRFLYINSSAAVHTVSRDTDVPNDDLAYSSLFTLTNPDPALSNTELCSISHRVEGYFFRDLKDKKFTLSFWVKATKTGTASICFRNQTGRNYVTTYTIDASNTWERKTIKVQHDSTGTWNYENGVGLDIQFNLESGPDNEVSTLDQWVSNASALCADTQDNFVEAGSTEFRLAGIMLTEDTGEVDFNPDFTRAGRNYQEELQLCQRYFEKSYDIDIAPGTLIGFGGTEGRVIITLTGTASIQTKLLFNTRKRDIPVMSGFSVYANSSNADREFSVDPASTLLGFGNRSETGCEPAFNSNRVDASRYSFQWTADAEL